MKNEANPAFVASDPALSVAFCTSTRKALTATAFVCTGIDVPLDTFVPVIVTSPPASGRVGFVPGAVALSIPKLDAPRPFNPVTKPSTTLKIPAS